MLLLQRGLSYVLLQQIGLNVLQHRNAHSETRGDIAEWRIVQHISLRAALHAFPA